MSTSNLGIIAANQELCPECQNAENKLGLDIACVLKELASARENKKKLSPRDACYLCLSFCGYNSTIIAYRLAENKMPENSKELENVKYVKKARNLKKDMSGRVHTWIKDRMEIPRDDYKPRSDQVIDFFKEICCKTEEKKREFNSLQGSLTNKNSQEFSITIEGNISPAKINQIFKQAGIKVNLKRIVGIEEEDLEQ